MLLFLLFFLLGSAIDYFEKAEQYKDSKDYINAIEYYKKAIEVNENYFDAYLGIGYCYTVLKNYDMAIKYYSLAEKLGPNKLHLLYNIAELYYLKSNFKKSFEYINKIRSINSKYIDSYFLEANIYMKQTFYGKALNIYTKLLNQYPENWKIYLGLFNFYRITDNYNLALNYMQKAIDIAPHEVVLYEHLLEFYFYNKELKKANEILLIIYDLDSHNDIARKFHSLIYKQSGNYKGSITILTDLYERYPYDKDIIWELADSYEENKQVRKSIDILKKTIEVYPSDELLRYYLESLLINNNDYEISLRKELAKYKFNWGDFYYKNGFVEKGIVYIQRAIELDNSNLDYRRKYSNILKNSKKIFKQLEQLKILKLLGDDEANKKISIIEHYYSDSVENKYGISSYDDKNKQSFVKIGIFFKASTYTSKKKYLIKQYFAKVFSNIDGINFYNIEGYYNDIGSVIEESKYQNLDFALIMDEDNLTYNDLTKIKFDLFSLSDIVSVYHKDYDAKGNTPLYDVIESARRDMVENIPLRGELLYIRGKTGVINLGYICDIKKGDKFYILKSHEIGFKRETTSIKYDDEKIEAIATVTAVGETVAEVEIKMTSLFSSIQKGFYCILINDENME